VTTDEKLATLIEEASALPDDAQAELVQSLIAMRFGEFVPPDLDDNA
jgi:hypothetical protein